MMAWTDERMDDMATQMREGFATVDTDINGVRAELHSSARELRTEIREVRTELKADIAHLRTELKGEIAAVRSGMNRWAVVIVVTMLGLFGANLVPGVGG